MPRRIVLFVAIAFAAAALFVRLGIWQLHRLGERRALNALVASRLDSAVIDASRFHRDTVGARYRRARVVGIPDYQHEVVVAARTHQGSPGVNLLTPVRPAGNDTAILVNRGWVYSPDGASVQQERWHDRDTVWTGFLEILPASSGRGGAVTDTGPVFRLDRTEVASRIPYPIAPVYLIAVEDSAAARLDTVPASERIARLSPPPLDEGPHLSYAIQWFFFATVAIVGAVVVMFRIRQPQEKSRR